MADQSFLDEQYFVDEHVYNCPFCNRRHVAYVIVDKQQFDWSESKKCSVYFVKCKSCGRSSMHLSFEAIPLHQYQDGSWVYRFQRSAGLDDAFFYSVPTSFFVLDPRVPSVLRELVTEAEGCLKSNFLTGASACARKIVYELARVQKGEGSNYDERIKSLKSLHPEVQGEFFDSLLTIQQVTSTKVHEDAHDGWKASHLRIILLSLREILHELYVVPALREDRRNAILALKEDLRPRRDASQEAGLSE